MSRSVNADEPSLVARGEAGRGCTAGPRRRGAHCSREHPGPSRDAACCAWVECDRARCWFGNPLATVYLNRSCHFPSHFLPRSCVRMVVGSLAHPTLRLYCMARRLARGAPRPVPGATGTGTGTGIPNTGASRTGAGAGNAVNAVHIPVPVAPLPRYSGSTVWYLILQAV